MKKFFKGNIAEIVLIPILVLIVLCAYNEAKMVEVRTETKVNVEPPVCTYECHMDIPEVVEPVVSEAPQEPQEPIEVVEETRYFDVPLGEDLQDHIFALCESRNIDPAIIMSMIFVESTYNPEKIGDSGNSYGLMQVQPKWHWDRMERLGVTDLLDPYQNVETGIDYLAELLDEGEGVTWALRAYNGGPSRGWNPNAEVIAYSDEVLVHIEELEWKVA